VTPEKLLFAKTHEWVQLDKDASGAKVATIGVSAFALEALTDLVYIELPKVGRKVEAGEPFGEIESVKAVSDLYSPVTGEVIAIHEGLGDRLETLNSDPYGEGWMVKIKLSSDAGLGELLDYAAYQKQCAEEGH
jgi:glycine cleavage system H protein